jgi:hypothetical protein
VSKSYAFPSDVTDEEWAFVLPSTAVLDSRTVKSTASSEGAAYDGANE